MNNNRLSITDVAKALGVTPRTIMRWEKAGKIKKSKRDWRGWRFYIKEDIEEIKKFYESSYEYDNENGVVASLVRTLMLFLSITALITVFSGPLSAEINLSSENAVLESAASLDINLNALPTVQQASSLLAEDAKYTLGPNDVIAIEVRRHPEFSGQYTVNSEGNIEYKFVGDVSVNSLTKAELREKLKEILAEYIISPDIDVSIAAYLSKVFFVVGEVRQPGKFYMRGNTLTIREALVNAGLPTEAAAMRRCRLITPNNTGKNNYSDVNVYKLLYEGDLKENVDMKPGDVLYVPATIIAKAIRVISPVTNFTAQTTGQVAKGAMFIP